MDNGFDIFHPDLIDNIVKDENGTPYGYNFDYGPCRNGDNKNCFGFNITDNTNQTGNIVFYGQDENIEATDNTTISLQEFNDIFKDYPTDYNWDDLKNNPIAYLPDEDGVNTLTNFQTNDHGTHVMGIIGASVNNSGIQGVAPNVDMIGINYSQSMYFGDDNVYKLTAETLAKENAKVINMSFGLDFDENLQHFNQASIIKDKDIANTNIEGIDYFLSMFEILADNNIVTVKSAGNNGNTLEADLLSGIPLSNNFKQGSEHDLTDLFISVVSVNKNNQLASYSQKCGASKEYCLAAPGGDFDDLIFSTVQNDGNHQKNDGNAAYGYATGTSMAAPVVTGSVALLMGAYPHLSSQQIVEILFKTATDIGDKGIDEIYGNGLLNLEAATSPIGYLTFDFSDVQNQKAYTQSALSLSKSANAKILKALPKKFVAFDEYNRGFEIKTASLFADTSKQQRHLFKNEFKAFMAKSVQDVKLSDNLSFAFNTSISGNDIYSPYGFLRLNYKHNNRSGFYAFYSDNTISNNVNAYNHTLRNPFISMDNAFGVGFNYKLGKVLFNFDYTSGKNNFFEDEDNSDLYDNKIDAFSAGLKYDFAHNLSVASNMGMLREDGSVLGMSGENAFDMGITNTYFAGLKLMYKPINKLSLSASYYRGYTKTLIESSLFDISGLVSESIAFNATYNLTPNNIMGIDVYSPLGILKGTADIYLASGRHRTENNVYLNKYQADLKDTKREWNLSMFYDTKIKEDTNFKTRFGVRINPEHQENVKPDYFGMIGLSFAF
ncbi:MAG: S8 family serine peptidase [Alphaproteobacteria bacterium]|nr:S8 family serine peptidase [Alphaproteobacteria bacterium]